MFKKITTIAAAAAAIGAGVIATAPNAQAATPRNGVCEAGEFCYSYNSGFAGSVSDFTASLGDYGTKTPSCYVFTGAKVNLNATLKNNNASHRIGEASPFPKLSYGLYRQTVIYLHSAPLSTLSVGQSVSVGQPIATESYRGISSASGYHTHVEVRPGKQYYAAKSVNDWVLSNPDPTAFWNARGYVER